jgi:Spy/CpxP family protein refolding chaperone
MKSLKKVLLPMLALAVGAVAPLSLSAQDRPARPERAGAGGPAGRGGDRLAVMSEQLGLTADQKSKVQAILEEERTSLEALRADTALTQEARRAKMQEIRQSFAGKVRAALTPEQQAKMGEMRGARGPGGPGAGGAGKAPKKDGNK